MKKLKEKYMMVKKQVITEEKLQKLVEEIKKDNLDVNDISLLILEGVHIALSDLLLKTIKEG